MADRLAFLAAGLLASWLSYRRGKRAATSSRAEHKKVFVLAVGLKFQSVADRDAFLEVWRPLAEYVAREESQTTLSFELCIADTDPTKVLVHERYISKEAFLTIHRTSEAFLAYKAAQQALPFAPSIEITGQSYIETNIGYM